MKFTGKEFMTEAIFRAGKSDSLIHVLFVSNECKLVEIAIQGKKRPI